MRGATEPGVMPGGDSCREKDWHENPERSVTLV